MKQHKTLSLIILLVLFAAACTKVVNINLNDSAPRIIIEGSVSDQRSSCYVRLSKSVNFNATNLFPPVTGATVFITDNLGNKSVLNETTPGYYTSPSYAGIFGRTYTLSVTAEGKTYTASSTMDIAVAIDAIAQDVLSLNSFGGSGKLIFVKIQYIDPAGTPNFYRFIEVVDNKESDDILIDNDVLRDGNTITQNIFRREPSLKPGNNVTILIQTIDKNVFNYFSQLNQISEGYGGQSTSPANPTGNFNNGALGYFSAYAVRSKSIVIK